MKNKTAKLMNNEKTAEIMTVSANDRLSVR